MLIGLFLGKKKNFSGSCVSLGVSGAVVRLVYHDDWERLLRRSISALTGHISC